MRATKNKVMTLWVVTLLVMPFVLIPNASAWTAGDEAAIFGHTFEEEYWTNDSIRVEGDDGTNASLTASFVHVGEFSSFLLAFNNANKTDGTQLIMPYQLFGMHFKTPENKEVFIGAVFAFLLVHDDNVTFADNDLPDMGHDNAWYIVPLASDNTWPHSPPAVEPIPATKLGEGHYRFGMRYYNLTCRVVDANTGGGFWLSLAIPLLTVLFTEFTVEYDIEIDETGVVHTETLYTIGQVTRAKDLFVERHPSELINETMEISAVHFLSVFASRYSVATVSGNTIEPPTATEPMDENVSIRVGNNDERAFDIGFGSQYSLINETYPPTIVDDDLTALNTLLAVRLSDLLLVAWQAPMSAWLFAHMAYGLSSQLRNTYATVGGMVSNANTAFSNTNWWYAVTFPTWNGLRVEQDPVYVAYTNLNAQPSDGGGIVVVILAVGIIAVIMVLRRRR